ncbi:MAG: hypothetical protein ACI4DT_01275 [Chordicoccus sp.]
MKNKKKREFPEKLQELADLSVETFYREEKKKPLPRKAFVLYQFRLMKKGWMILQAVLLIGIYVLLHFLGDLDACYRLVAVLSTLLIIFFVPELWREKREHSIDLINSCYYSIEELYAAKLLIAGLYDLLILSVFFIVTLTTSHVTVYRMILHFLLPMLVTACICLVCLSAGISNYYITLSVCIAFSGLWYAVTSFPFLYRPISTAAWVVFLILSVVLLAVQIRRIVHGRGLRR